MISSTFDSKKLLKALKIFPERIQKNIMVGSVRAGAKPILNEAKGNVPVRTGNLRKSLGITKRKSKSRTEIRFSISPRKGGKNDGFYGHMIEFGTSNMSARPFMRPAFENQDKNSIDEAKKYMSKRIDKEIIKARR